MCRLMPPYVVWRVQKDLEVFKKARHLFHVGQTGSSPPSLSRLFLLFRSSFHFNRNTRTINRLRMTGHPLILLSAAFIKSLQNLPSAFVFLILVEEVLRMKGGWKGGDTMFIHYRTPINRAFQRLMKGEREKSLKSQVCFWSTLAVNGFIAIGKPSREA